MPRQVTYSLTPKQYFVAVLEQRGLSTNEALSAWDQLRTHCNREASLLNDAASGGGIALHCDEGMYTTVFLSEVEA